MNRAKVIVVSILCVLGLVLFLVAYNLFAGEKEDDGMSVANVPTAKVQDNFTYQEMMEYREANPNDFRTGRTKIQVDDQNSIDTLMFRIADIENNIEDTTEEVEPVTEWQEYEAAPPAPRQQQVAQAAPAPSRGGGGGVYQASHIIEAQEEILGNNNEPEALPIQAQQRRRRDGFIDGRGSTAGQQSALSGVQVVTMGDQFVEAGGIIKLRVTEATNVAGLDVPKNTVIYGSVSQGQNRLNVAVSAIAVGNTATPASLSAYDVSDGMAGLKITQQQVDPQQQSMANNVGDEVLRSTGIYGLPVIGSIGRGAKDLLTRNRNRNGILVSDNYSLVLK